MAFHLEQRARGVSPHTARAQKGDLEKLLAHALPTSWPGWEVKPRVLRRFALELGERGLDPASQARILSTARAFFRWLFETQRIQSNPASGPAESQAAPAPAGLPHRGGEPLAAGTAGAHGFPHGPAALPAGAALRLRVCGSRS